MSETKKIFHNSTDFNKNMVEILSELLEGRLKELLDFCISTNNAEPIKRIIELIKENHFDNE